MEANVLDQVKDKFTELQNRLRAAKGPVAETNEAVPEVAQPAEVVQAEALEEEFVITEPKMKKPRKKRTPSYKRARKRNRDKREKRKMRAAEKKMKKTCKKRGCEVRLINNHMKWCATHRGEVRKMQTRRNNQVWRARKRAGKAGHHKQYAGKPTKWATAQRDAKVPKRKKATRK